MIKIINPLMFLANIFGIIMYLKNASSTWAIPEEAGLNPGIAGSAFVWALGALPILIIFLAADAGWFYTIRRLKLARVYSYVMFGSWTCAVIFDFMHH